MGFTLGIDIQRTFMKVPELKNITKIVCGLNHVLALDTMGRVWSWGAGQQCQLGKRVVERTRASLTPREFGMGKGHVYIGVGSYHSFAIHGNGTVKAWGLNSFGQTGCADDLGENEAVVPRPKEVPSLSGKDIVHLTGGAHHTLAVTGDGQCLGWGRLDGCQLGIDGDDLPEESKKRDDRGKVRICTVPTQVPNIDGTVVSASAGPDQCLTVTNKGRAFSWGFSVNYQTGQGTTDDVEEATLIDNTATRGEKLIFAGAGGQFGVLASKYEEAE
jgi:regulator of chromosome condensation